ncbi:hypothetical protein SAMN05443662_0982 [Sulfurivirga caldicuralii]|uniref:Phosphoglycerate mutase n=1 Tax=Sulfurivirga caldicuralii TaxID=364032 RepID=A0A1N6F9K9_9GAMM|nr:hypothetical protein [Sulfurivirga caldicuralii]SIN91965.1 hypothetical protein SAMN05443662_0982 [Sulfurivirga caldicuralii]
MTQLVIYAPQLTREHTDAPALAPWLRYADRLPAKAPQGLARSAYWLHQTPPVPWAAITAAEDLQDFDPERFYLRMDPVHLHPDRDTLVLFRAEAVGMTEAEARELFDAFNAHFAEEGVQLQWGAEDRWYVSLPQAIDLRTVPLPDAEHANLHAVPMQGEATSHWNRLLTEAQMLFYQHPLNERRRAQNLPEINSLWPWGEGVYSQWHRIPRNGAAVYSPFADIEALARQVGASVLAQPCVENLGVASSGNILLDWQAQPLDWVLTQLEAVSQQLKQRRLSGCVLDVGGESVLSLKPAMLRRFWRCWGAPRYRNILNSQEAVDLERLAESPGD